MDIALETVCYVINRAREVMADMDPIDDEPGGHSGDDLADDLPENDDAGGAGLGRSRDVYGRRLGRGC